MLHDSRFNWCWPYWFLTRTTMKKLILLLLATSEYFHWLLHYLQCRYPLCQYNDTINHPTHIFIRITSIKHLINIKTTNEFIKKYSKNSFLKDFKTTSYSYMVQSMNLHEKPNEWFPFQNNIDWKWIQY